MVSMAFILLFEGLSVHGSYMTELMGPKLSSSYLCGDFSKHVHQVRLESVGIPIVFRSPAGFRDLCNHFFNVCPPRRLAAV